MKRIQALLENKLADLLRRRIHLEELHVDAMADPLDQLNSGADRDLAVHSYDRHAALVADLRSALQRLDEGTFGHCEECGHAITKARLHAVPWARRCVACQARGEHQAA